MALEKWHNASRLRSLNMSTGGSKGRGTFFRQNLIIQIEIPYFHTFTIHVGELFRPRSAKPTNMEIRAAKLGRRLHARGTQIPLAETYVFYEQEAKQVRSLIQDTKMVENISKSSSVVDGVRKNTHAFLNTSDRLSAVNPVSKFKEQLVVKKRLPTTSVYNKVLISKNKTLKKYNFGGFGCFSPSFHFCKNQTKLFFSNFFNEKNNTLVVQTQNLFLLGLSSQKPFLTTAMWFNSFIFFCLDKNNVHLFLLESKPLIIQQKPKRRSLKSLLRVIKNIRKEDLFRATKSRLRRWQNRAD